MLTFNILTIFSKIFNSYFKEALLGKAQADRLLKINVHNLREYAKDNHKTTDDRPFGGGPGMVMMIEPIFRALQDIAPLHLKKLLSRKKYIQSKTKIILLSPRGKQFTQKLAEQWSKLDNLILICGRYEGIDERVRKYLADEEISIGPYVLSGGEVGSMVIIEAVSRLLHKFLGNQESLKEESYGEFKKEYPHYTRPAVFSPSKKLEWKVPQVLLSGHHEKIKSWRNKNSSEE